MELEEGLAEHFYKKLFTPGSNPAVILAQLYSIYYKEDNLNAKLIPVFGRLVKLYGRNTTFQALLDLFNIEKLDFANIDRFIIYLTKKKFESKFIQIETNDLSRQVLALREEAKKVRKAKIEEKNPFDE